MSNRDGHLPVVFLDPASGLLSRSSQWKACRPAPWHGHPDEPGLERTRGSSQASISSVTRTAVLTIWSDADLVDDAAPIRPWFYARGVEAHRGR